MLIYFNDSVTITSQAVTKVLAFSVQICRQRKYKFNTVAKGIFFFFHC